MEILKYILEFTFTNFWTFIGVMLILGALARIIFGFAAIAKALVPKLTIDRRVNSCGGNCACKKK